jgi:beta-N-acetylhexosaminidase
MTAHVLYPALDEKNPATLSSSILGDLLRGRMGFDGLLLTDDLEMQAILDHVGIAEASLRAFQAGADMLLICKDQTRQIAAMDALYRAAEDGILLADRIAASLRRVARVKERFLLPYKPADLVAARVVVGSGSHQALKNQLLQAAGQPKAPA